MSTETMTSKERILAAMAGESPDRVPVQLGITNMFSIRQQGYSGWDVFHDNKVPYWQVVTDTARRFGLDGYLYLNLDLRRGASAEDGEVRSRTEIVDRTDEKIVKRTTVTTPKGELWSECTLLKNETPTTTRGLLKTKEDFEIWLEYCFPEDEEFTTETIDTGRAYLGEDGTAAGIVGIPGLAALAGAFDGKVETASYFAYDYPELLDVYRERAEAAILRRVERLFDADVDYIQLGSSGMLTLSTPELFRRLCLPTIKRVTRICREAGILTELHCCGKERLVVEACHDETDLDSINPLQPPPMGDCDLAEIKRLFGDTLCLKGNVGVTDPLFAGTPEDVERDVIRCMEAAKAGGRFILFSEEGIGGNTPVENVEQYVEVGKRYGGY